MPISATRVKFLDKENKILVKNLRDITSNDVLSNILTPLTDLEWLSQHDAFQSLIDLQQNLQDIYRMIRDGNISDFLGANFLNSLNLSDPALSHLAGTIALLKQLDSNSLNTFIGGLMASAADKLFDNPSIFQNYRGIGNDIKLQILLSSIDIFGSRVAQGLVTADTLMNSLGDAANGLLGVSGVSSGLRNLNASVQGLNTSTINALLKALGSSTAKYDLDKPVTGNYTIPPNFYGNGGIGVEGNGSTTPGNNGGGTTTPPGNGGYDQDYVLQLFKAMISIRREIYRRLAFDQVNNIYWMTSYMVAEYNLISTLKAHIENFFLNSTVTMAHLGDGVFCFLRSLIMQKIHDYYYNKNSVLLGDTYNNLDAMRKAVDIMLRHVYMQELLKREDNAFNFLELGDTKTMEFLNSMINKKDEDIPTLNFKKPDGILAEVIESLETYYEQMLDKAIITYASKVNSSKDKDIVAIPMTYAKLKLAEKILATDPLKPPAAHKESEARIFLCTYIFKSLFAEKVRPALTSNGYKVGRSILRYDFQENLNEHIYNFLTALSKHFVPDLSALRSTSLENKILFACYQSYTKIVGAVSSPDNYETDGQLIKIIGAFTQPSYELRGNYQEFFDSPNLSVREYTEMSLPLSKFKYANRKVKIV